MEGLDLGQTSNPSLAWKKGMFSINDDEETLKLKDIWKRVGFKTLFSKDGTKLHRGQGVPLKLVNKHNY